MNVQLQWFISQEIRVAIMSAIEDRRICIDNAIMGTAIGTISIVRFAVMIFTVITIRLTRARAVFILADINKIII